MTDQNGTTNIIAALSHVTKTIEGTRRTTVTIVEDINLQLKKDRITALLGPSGSGKSTLIKIISGLQKPTSGEVIFNGMPLEAPTSKISIAFQNFALFPWLTVFENVAIVLEAKGADRQEIKDKALKILDTIGLDGFEDAYPKELSGGMKQRVGFARSLIVEPELLCMDEPFSALDILTAENLRREFIELWTDRKLPTKAILLVTHNIEEAVFFADECIILSKNPGRIRANISINLPHKRNTESDEFKMFIDMIYQILTNPEAEAESIQSKFFISREKYQMLPNAKPGAIAGLLELVFERGGEEDIYKLSDELQMEVDDILPIVDACVLLQFVRVTEGDITLTEQGKEFVTADILERKVNFSRQAMGNAVLVKQIIRLLTAKKNHKLHEDFIEEYLSKYFTQEEAKRQLEIAVTWGRFGELFSYDASTGELYIEEPAANSVRP
ncbi:MAG: nitrate/sulfonate/bicarbonate ABC transporter ATP-binding protein [Deltaproteobacteria bacterium]|nr:nitrate/sulfonate/bicarbonate ABC transporter ATP-binding protein [Deltaproteobacteria bacterium]MCL5277091.1 nitrate/sulfonate/bicarbonate ABC transporter ATP-binding protein [Deltaproteobacteria bacterium]